MSSSKPERDPHGEDRPEVSSSIPHAPHACPRLSPELTTAHPLAREFEPEAASVPAARRFLTEALDVLELEPLAFSARLALSEIVTNAVLHARTQFRIELDPPTPQDPLVRISVIDASPNLPEVRSYGLQATTGRGLSLVAALSAQFGVESVGTGKRIWFTLDVTHIDALNPPTASLPAARAAEEACLAVSFGSWDVESLLAELGSSEPPLPPPPPARGPLDRDVELRSLPVRLWRAAQEHQDALLRELVLINTDPGSPSHAEVAALDLEGAQRAHNLLTQALTHALMEAERSGVEMVGLPEGHPSPLPPAPAKLSVGLVVAPEDHACFQALQDVLDLGEGLALADELLTAPALPEIVAIRDWCAEQVLAQVNGVAASPWSDPGDLTGTAAGRFVASLPDWDSSEITASTRCVVAADDNNRILAVSGPLAALLGWGPDELLGRRVVALIPPRLREAHVAGFTRHLTTGESHVLGVPLNLPVLASDGSEIIRRFVIESVPAAGGRAVYLAWMDDPAEFSD